MTDEIKTENQILAENIRIMRKRKKFTLKDLSREVGTSDSYLCEIEKHWKVPNVFLVRRIARALKMKMEKLIDKPIE